MKYWYLSFQPHTTEFQAWRANGIWTMYPHIEGPTPNPGDLIFIGNQGNGIFAWGYLQSIGSQNRDGRSQVVINRGNFSSSLISPDLVRLTVDLSNLFSPSTTFTFITNRQVQLICNLLPEPKPPAPTNRQYILNSTVTEDEDIDLEYKDVNANKVSAEAYEYAIAFARGTGGRIIFGVNDRGTVVGIRLEFEQRDQVKRRIEEKLSTIYPPLIAVKDYTIGFQSVIDENGNEILDTFVIELEVKGTGDDHRSAGGKKYHKTFSGRQKLH